MKVLSGLALGLSILAAVGCSSGQSSRPAAAPVVRAKASLILIPGESSCQENPPLAYVNCSIGVRNRGDAHGEATVYVGYRYSDSGYTMDWNASPTTIPAHSLRYVYFSHSYNAQQHSLIEASASLDQNAQNWPSIRVADPNDRNWPNG